MKNRASISGIIKDDRAQALTEFAITIPVILLFFFMFLQYFVIVRTSQLANYAAFVAARSYAVHATVDGATEAKDMATKAAAMAFAPVASLAPGEVAGIGGSLSGLVPSGLPSIFSSAADLVEGYFVAYKIRLNSSIGGGSVNISTNGSPPQIDVEINYPQPVYIPGLAELWALVAGNKIYTSLKPLHQGLTGIPGTGLPLIEGWEAAQQVGSQFGTELPNLPTPLFPYINVKGKCSIGFSDWGSKDPEYRPRKHSDGNESDSTTTDPNAQNAANQAQQSTQDAKNYQDALSADQQACGDLCQAKSQLAQAQQQRTAVYNNPNSTPAQKAQADQAVSDAQNAVQSAQTAYDSANQTFESARQTIQTDTGKSYADIPCSCP